MNFITNLNFLIFLNFFFYSQSQLTPDSTIPTCRAPGCTSSSQWGTTVNYLFVVEYTILPGTNKTSITVNGTIPGPKIDVIEGDIVIVDVINHLDDKVTLHWHGMYQYGTSFNDGVPGVSQCLIPPTGPHDLPFRYLFLAEPAGTTWWHGHYNNQYIDGLFGPIIIHRNGGELYRSSFSTEWIWQMNDWYDYPAAVLREEYYLTPLNPDGVEPEPDAIMVNGKFTGELQFPNVNASERVLVRIINSAGFSMYNISVDGLPLMIVAIDGNDIEPPFVVSSAVVNVAQRIDVILDFPNFPLVDTTSIQFHVDAVLEMYPVDITNWTQPSPPYPPNTKCRFDPNFVGTISFLAPTTAPLAPLAPLSNRTCPSADVNYLDARPYDHVNFPAVATNSINMTISFQTLTDIQLAYINNLSFTVSQVTEEAVPELYAFVQESIVGNATTVAKQRSGGGYDIQNDGLLRFYIFDNSVVDVFLINTDGGDHPFHLHGHSFPIVATSDCPQAQTAFAGNYLRRDTVSVPAADENGVPGWLWFRFTASNPGAWLIHCHIDWHMEAGLGALFMEGPNQVFQDGPPAVQAAICPVPHDDSDSSDDSLTNLEISLIATSGFLFICSLLCCIKILLDRYGGGLKQSDRHTQFP